MKLRIVSVLGVVAITCGIASQIPDSSVMAQGAATDSKPATSAKSADAGGENGKIDGRVPAYYAQIGLSKEQRNKVLEVQASYAAKIDALKKQIADLDAKRETDVRGVLTDDQKKKLDELVSAAKKKAAETRSKAKSSDAPKDAPK